MKKFISLNKALGCNITQEEINEIIKEANEWPPGIYRRAFINLAKRMQKQYDEQCEKDKPTNK